MKDLLNKVAAAGMEGEKVVVYFLVWRSPGDARYTACGAASLVNSI